MFLDSRRLCFVLESLYLSMLILFTFGTMFMIVFGLWNAILKLFFKIMILYFSFIVFKIICFLFDQQGQMLVKIRFFFDSTLARLTLFLDEDLNYHHQVVEIEPFIQNEHVVVANQFYNQFSECSLAAPAA
jgi:hypothetical protein